MAERCKERSRAAGQPMPHRESHVSPGTCVWCFRRIPTAEEYAERVAYVRTLLEAEPGRAERLEAPIHPSDLRGLRFRP